MSLYTVYYCVSLRVMSLCTILGPSPGYFNEPVMESGLYLSVIRYSPVSYQTFTWAVEFVDSGRSLADC